MAAPNHLTLLVPGLLGPWGMPGSALTEALSVPALERLLSRADPGAGQAGAMEALLFHAFGYREPGPDLPVGAVTAAVDLGDDQPPDGWWLRADPVHLRADRDTLVLTAHQDLGLSDEQAARLVGELQEVFSPRGARLYAGGAERWYLHLPHAAGIRTYPPSQVLGQGIRPYLPEGEDAARWRALMNEAQMQLNLSPVTGEREAAGAVTANSLWFWGGGRAPHLQPPWNALWCNDLVGRGLARLAGIPCHPVPQDGAYRPAPDPQLIVLEGPARALGSGDPAGWQAAVQSVHDRWLAPAVAALARGDLQALTLSTGGGTDYTLTRASNRRWWRRPKALARFLATP